MGKRFHKLAQLVVKDKWDFKIGKSDFNSSRKWAVAYSGTLRVFFDDIMISHLKISSEDKKISISKSQYCIAMAETGFFLRKKLDAKLVEDLEEINSKLKNGIAIKSLISSIEDTNLVSTVSKNRFGDFLQISYPDYFVNSISNSIKVYLGSSIKQGAKSLDFEELVKQYENRLMAKSFNSEKEGEIYYRFYLRKEKL